ncbi:hypothetical protein [Burkholderia sp. Bp9143]|uniref:hypothetical protein n=1 Tax=Burkholderia sp. Bp9143 TaxID=2184574 RepID=UPI000F5A0186|nr:hypothetical protein [Burkholderia sp. Bp9143]
MFSTATPLPGKSLERLSEDRALLDIDAASNRVQTGGLNDKRVEYTRYHHAERSYGNGRFVMPNRRSNGDIADAANDSNWWWIQPVEDIRVGPPRCPSQPG